MNDLISVIVPIYKVEKYISKCISSIINQTYTNLEIILVDDGSPDNCPRICDEYAKKDNRISVIHKINGGLSDARNAGIDACSGKYIVFIDSDDYIKNNMIEKLYIALKNNNCDIAICNYYLVDENRAKMKIRTKLKDKIRIVDDNEKYDYLYNEYKMLSVTAWNKLYKKEIFNDIRYPKGKLNEDEYIIIDILQKAHKIAYINDGLYYYIQRNNSIIHTFNMKRFEILDYIKNRANMFYSKGDISNYMQTKLLEYSLTLNLMAEFHNCNMQNNIFEKEKINRIHSLKKDIKIYHFEYISIKDRIRVIFPKTYMFIKTKSFKYSFKF